MAPNLNIMADPGTNRVIATGVQYDASGNMTNDGTQAYSYDEANRLLTSGVYSYTYSGLENKRLVIYGSITSPSATLNLYGPDGKRLGWYRFGTLNGWTTVIPQGFSNYLYLGNKPLNYADDRTGSNRSDGTYYPYGNPYSNANFSVEDQAFGTYVQDSGSALLYADQRYYNPGYGRFMTADRSDANIDPGNPTSWNRFGYTNEDPVNGVDPTGLDTTVCYLLPGAYMVGECVFIPDGTTYTPPDDAPVSQVTNSEVITVDSADTWIDQYDPSTTPDGIAPTSSSGPLNSSFNNGSTPAIPLPPFPRKHYCGPGTGSGDPNGQVDELCQRHDQCYQDNGISAFDVVTFGQFSSPQVINAQNYCDAQLCRNLRTMIPNNSSENGDAFFVGAFFGAIHGSVSSCIP